MSRRDRHLGTAGPSRRRPASRTRTAEHQEAEEIRAFLTGRTNGGSLLHALYDHVLDEPVPERLSALLKN